MTPEKLISNIESEIVNPAIWLLFAIAFLVFLYGVWEALRNASSDTGRANGRRHIIWGVIGMAIMVSAFGLVNVICGTIGCDNAISRVK